MPELPEVESFRKYAEATSLHQRIERVQVGDDRILGNVSRGRLGRRLKGAALVSAARHGKFLFAGTDRGAFLVLHFGMTGRLAYGRDTPPRPRYARLLLRFANGFRLAYVSQRMLGEVSLTDDVAAFVSGRGLGPDAAAVGREAFRSLFGHRRGAVKPALMNQGILAGLGNLYADEVLFQVGVHPSTPLCRLDDRQLDRLFAAMRRVLTVALRRRAAIAELPRSYLLRHRAEGRPCPRCGTPLRRIKVVQRGTCYCPACQPAPP